MRFFGNILRMPGRKLILIAAFIAVILVAAAYFGYQLMSPISPISPNGASSSSASSSAISLSSARSSTATGYSDAIQITQTTPAVKELLRSAQTIAIEGTARSDINTIRAWKFCEGDYSGSFVNVPVVGGKWSFTYSVEPMGICRGRNTIVFQSAADCSEYYSPNCHDSKWFETNSDVGYLYPYAVMLNRDSSKSPDKTILSGIAGSSVDGIDANVWCMSAEVSKTVNLQRPSGVSGEWHWELPLTVEDKTLCRGQVSVNLRSTNRCTEYCDFHNQLSTATDLFFDDGYFPPEKDQAAQQVLALQKNIITQVPDDKSVQTTIYSDLLTRCDELEKTNPTLPKIVVPPKKLDDNLSVQLVGSGTTATLEFILTGTGSRTIKVPKALSHSCNDATIYYLRPDRIIINQGGGYESGPYISLWNGKEWKDLRKVLQGQVPVQTNLSTGGINKQHFVIKETGYCCDITNPVVLGRWANYVIDVDTLKIIDVFFDDR